MQQSLRFYKSAITAAGLALLGTITPAAALQDWTMVPAACAGTDNNFFSGSTLTGLPVARFSTPSGTFRFNGNRHTGFIAIHCNVDNPRDQGTNPGWNQLEVTYIDPDGVFAPDVNFGQTHIVFVQSIRINKTTGAQSAIAEFDSNRECGSPLPSLCNGPSVRTFVKRFTHTFDFANNAYVVFGRLFRGTGFIGFDSPVLVQLRLNAR